MPDSLIVTIGTIIVAIIETFATLDRKKAKQQNHEAEERAKIRAEESRLSMKMMYATMQLSIVSANALAGGKNNGNVEEAKKEAEEAQKEYEAFLRRVAAAEIGGTL